MNKKIKVIELLNKIANGEYPKKFKYEDKIYEYKRIIQGTGYVTENYDWFNSDIYIDDWDNLNYYVEILEDNTEEIEELGVYCDLIGMTENEKVLFNMIRTTTSKVDELVKAINSIRKDKNND